MTPSTDGRVNEIREEFKEVCDCGNSPCTCWTDTDIDYLLKALDAAEAKVTEINGRLCTASFEQGKAEGKLAF